MVTQKRKVNPKRRYFPPRPPLWRVLIEGLDKHGWVHVAAWTEKVARDTALAEVTKIYGAAAWTATEVEQVTKKGVKYK